jgi:SAM-dependent methyltransferase
MRQYEFRQSYYSTHQIIVRILKVLVGPTSSILDVGCNTGYLGEYVGQGLWTGIERDQNVRAELEHISAYQKIIFEDIERVDFKQFAPEEFDVILMADVLEHLVNPERILHEMSALVKHGGKVIISLPNVANWRIRLLLLLGFFSYKEVGILDRTHLHLYEKHTARQLLELSGFLINKMVFTSSFFGIIIKFIPCLGPLLGHGIVIVAQSNKE